MMTRKFLILCVFVRLITSTLNADRTFVWSGDDQRFSGWFSISEKDFQNRSFETLTAARFAFTDSARPSLSAVLEDPRGFYSDNTTGKLTSDGQRLSHETLPNNANVAFWVAVWKYPGIDVGMYGHNSGELQEFFTYANHPAGLIVTSTGAWTLVPEPSTLTLLFSGAFIVLICKRHRP